MSFKYFVVFIAAIICAHICTASIECPVNSEPAQCGRICEPTCSNPQERYCKIDPSQCKIACRCLKGYVRDEKTDECIKPEQCC